jgi:hypothetical protein
MICFHVVILSKAKDLIRLLERDPFDAEFTLEESEQRRASQDDMGVYD